MIEKTWPVRTDDRSITAMLAAGALVVILLLYLRPYHGIRHDSTLYLGQALLRWRPEIFGQDLFFVFGSQADFTIFPYLISRLLDFFGVAELFLVLTLLGRLLFFLASWLFLRCLFNASAGYWGLLALVVLSPMYGGYGVFSYAEPFLTGRSFSEPLVLMALAAWWSSRPVWAIAIGVVAASIHPLQAVPAFLVFWLDLLQRDRRWLHLLWLGVIVGVAAALGVMPFAKWLATYDSQWFEWIEVPNSNCFMTKWRAADWCYLAFDVFLVSLIVRHAKGRLQSYARTLLIASACGLGTSLIFVDLLHFVLPTGLQLWRIHWLLHWLAMASIPWLILLHFRVAGRWTDMRLLIILSMLSVTIPVGPMPLPPYAILILIPLYLYWPKVSPHLGSRISKLVGTGLVLMMLISFGRLVFIVWNIHLNLPDVREMFRPEVLLLSYPLLAGGVIGGLYAVWQRWHMARIPMLGVLASLLVYAAATWDHRNPWTAQVESAQFSQDVFGVELAAGAQVFWKGELLAPWLILNRPSYMSNEQNAGLLFNRGTAEEAHRRMSSMHVFNFQNELCQVVNQYQDGCVPDDAAVAEICAGSNGQLTYIVLTDVLKTPAYGRWTVKGGVRGDRPITYWLYRCEDLFKTVKGGA